MTLSKVRPLVVLALGVLVVAGFAARVADAACPNDALRTGASAMLPDCRAYELVSPRAKANDVIVNTNRFRIAASERPGLPMAAVFPSLGGFPGSHGSGVAFDYMAQRTMQPGTQGWTTHAITPLQDPLSLDLVSNGFDALYVGEGDPDLTRMVHRTITPVTPAPNMRKLSKLYLRTDLRSAGTGTYELLADAVAPLNAPILQIAQNMMHPAGASTDLRRVLFESVFPLTADAPPSLTRPKLYKSVDGDVQLVGVLPASEGGGVAPSALAGQSSGGVNGNAAFTPGVISQDGSRAFFTVPEVLGDQNSYTGRLYMRDDSGTADPSDDVSVRINESEADVADATRPATYWNAAVDGSRVFFTTTQALTNDAPVGNEKLYVYDTTQPPAARNLTFISADREPSDGGLRPVFGVMDISDDGRTAYFVQRGQIVPGQPAIDPNLGIYAWREGEGVKYVGQMLEDQENLRDVLPDRHHVPNREWGAAVTPDGGTLLVSLRQPPWPGGFDHGDCPGPGRRINGKNGCSELYLYDYESGDQPVCVSCDPDGTVPTTPAFVGAREGAGGSQNATHRNQPLTSDASRVFFTTGESLLPADVNGKFDAYQYDVATGRLHLLSTGQSSSNSYFLDATPDGQDVFIATREQLSPWDVDQNADVYDVRVDGGVAPPETRSSCQGDPCQGNLAEPPAAPLLGSSTFSAPPEKGKVTKPRARPRRKRCRRGKVRRRVHGRVRCVTRERAHKLDARRAHRRKVDRDRARTRGRGGAR